MSLIVHADYIRENQDLNQIRSMVRRLIYKEWSVENGREHCTAIVVTEVYDPIDEKTDLVMAVVGHPATVRLESRVRHGIVRVFDKDINPIGGLSLPRWMSTIPMALVSLRGRAPHHVEAHHVLISAFEYLFLQLKFRDVEFCSSVAKNAILEDPALTKKFVNFLMVRHWGQNKALHGLANRHMFTAIIFAQDTSAFPHCQYNLRWATFVNADADVENILKRVRTMGTVALVEADEDVGKVLGQYESLITECHNAKTAEWEEKLQMEDMCKRNGFCTFTFPVKIW